MININLAITLIIVVSVISLVLTLLLAGKSDVGYNDRAKRNVTHLTLIYLVAILLSVIAFAVYVINFAA